MVIFETKGVYGHHFGELYHRMRGIVIIKLSPYELKAFHGIFLPGIPNVLRRCVESAPYSVPPFLLGYFLTKFLDARHKKINRKNPKDYINDV